MEWIIAIGVAVAILIFALFLASKKAKWPSSTQSDNSQSSAATKRISRRRPSAAEMLSSVHELRAANAQWDMICSQLNPNADRDIERLLFEIRGPHLFNPALGLGVIEDGCRRVLASSPDADAVVALREAIHSARPFVR